jgi:uncharacterized membrane-anchored protein
MTAKTLLSLAAVALAQTAVLAYMVIDRVQLLRTGREITLPIAPVDPRDLFRGDYVVLRYDISSVPVGQLEGGWPRRNEPLYVTLEKNADGAWRPVGVARTMPSESNADRIVLKGRPGRGGWSWMRYGIESYFVPEGEGRRLEAMVRDRKLAVLVAVDKSGNAAIKGLIIDGKLQYEEPLF